MSKKYYVDVYPKFTGDHYVVKFRTLKEAKMYAENKANELKNKFHLIEVLKIIDRNLYEIIEEY